MTACGGRVGFEFGFTLQLHRASNQHSHEHKTLLLKRVTHSFLCIEVRSTSVLNEYDKRLFSEFLQKAPNRIPSY